MRLLLLPVVLMFALPAYAQVEQLDQIEPDAGEIQAEVFTGPGGTAFEALIGVSRHFALGGEVEMEDGRVEEAGAVALVRFTDPDRAPLGLGIGGQAMLGAGGRLRELELRGLIERRGKRWWVQLDPILRHARDSDGGRGTGIAYAVSAQRSLAGGVWLGAEASGRLARLSGSAELAPAAEHYAGPSLTVQARGGDVEIGLAWLQRLKGQGAKSGPRLFVQLSF
ncbi:hypothetical protein ACG3SL_07255 [Sphingomonas sp. CJ20]